jgi:hypothetical protein
MLPSTPSSGDRSSSPQSNPGTSNGSVPRRPTREQGRALEILGHAIEYLIDSSAYAATLSPEDLGACHLLSTLSRTIYAESPVAPTLGSRLQTILIRMFGRPQGLAQPIPLASQRPDTLNG